jgi:hypothetical protein
LTESSVVPTLIWLSNLVKTETAAKGRITLHREYSKDLQRKAGHFTRSAYSTFLFCLLECRISRQKRSSSDIWFPLCYIYNIKIAYCCSRLIPNSLQNRSEIVKLVESVRVSTATSINQDYILISDTFKAAGRPDKGQFTYVSKETHLNLFLTEEAIKSPCPPFELVEFLATYCNIKEPRERALLQIALNEKDVKRIQQTFYREGILKREELVDCKYIRLVWTTWKFFLSLMTCP